MTTVWRDSKAALGAAPDAADQSTVPNAVSAEIIGILDTVDVPILVVSRDYRIIWFNPAASKMLELSPAHINQSACNIAVLADMKDFEQRCAQVIADAVPTRHDIQAGDQWFMLRIAPYLKDNRAIAGAVLTLTNVTALRASVAQAVYEREYTKAILNTMGESLVVLDSDLRLQTANRAFYETFGVSREQVQGIPISSVFQPLENCSSLWDSLKATHSTNGHGGIDRREIECLFPAIGRRTICLDARRLSQGGAILLVLGDITEQKAAEALRITEAAELSKLNQLSSRLWQMRDLEEGLDEMLSATIKLLGADFGNIQIFDAAKGFLQIVVQRGFEQDFLDYFREVSVEDDSACGRALRSGKQIIIEDIESDEPYAPMRPIARAAGYRAVQSTPLIGRHGKPLGMISTHFCKPHRPAEQELSRLELYARQASDFIERCWTDQALRASEERYRQLAKLLPVAVYTCDATGLITYYNPTAAELWGRAPKPGDTDERFCGSEQMVLDDGRVLPHDQCPMAVALRDGSSFREQPVNVRRPDGSMVSVRVNIDPIKDAQGRIVGAINVFHDVTELRRAEQALRDSEARYRAIVESQSEMVCRFRPDGNILFANGAYARAQATAPDALVGANFWNLIEAADRQGVKNLLDQLTPDNPQVTIENRFETVDGVRWTLWTNRGLAFDERGRVTEAQSTGIDITARKQAEQALRESEATRRFAMQAAGTGSWTWDEASEAVTWSEETYELFGIDPRTPLLYESWRNALHPEDRERADAAARMAMERGHDLAVEYRVRHPKRGERWLASIGRMVDPANRPGYMTGISMDITDRKRAEQALQDHARTLETLNRVGSALSAELDTRKVIQAVTDAGTALSRAKFGALFFNAVNEQGEAYLLYTLSGAPREAFEKFGIPRATPLFGPTFAGQGVVRSDDITKDSRYGRMGPHHGMPEGHLPVRSYLAVPVISRSGVVLGGLFFGHPDVGVFTEQSERLITGLAAQAAVALDNARLHESLTESEERFRTMVENIPQLAWMARANGHIYWYNRRWYEYTGTTSESQEGWGWKSVHHPEHVEKVTDKWAAALSAGEPWEDTFPLRGKDGEYRWFLSRAYPIRDRDGNILRWFGTNTDITDQREAQQVIARHATEVAKALDQRTYELTEAHEQLRRGEAMAILGALSAGIAHDLTNIIFPMQARLQAIQGLDLPSAAGEHIRLLLNSVQYLRDLGQRVRRYMHDAGDDSAADRQDRESIDLARWCRSVDQFLRGLLPSANSNASVVELHCEIPPGLPRVNVNVTGLTQAVYNVVQNAVKAMRHANTGQSITLKAACSADDRRVLLTIEDDGPGMSPEVLAHCHEAGFTTDEKSGGMGLGLSLVKAFADSHGGELRIDSPPVGKSRGTAVVIGLRTAVQQAGTVEPARKQLL